MVSLCRIWLPLLLLLTLLAACEREPGETTDVRPSLPATAVSDQPVAPERISSRQAEPEAILGTAATATLRPPRTDTPFERPTGVAITPPEPEDGEDASVLLPEVHSSFSNAPDRDLVELARSLRLKTATPIERIVGPPSGEFEVGRIDDFWLTSLDPVAVYSREFVLRHVSPNAYWYVQEGLNVSDDQVVRGAEGFENDLYPRTTELWGTEWKPGVDGDPRLTILNGRLRGGAAGYFSSADEYPTSVHPHSNQREMIYMNAEYLRVGSSGYLSVLAHELFHTVAWAADASEETWVSEGMAELSTYLLGHHPGPPYAEVRSPTPSLVNWPLDPLSGANYAHSMLFFQYLSEQVDMPHDLIRLAEHPANGVYGVDAYLRSLNGGADFRQMFADWLVANFLDQPEGRYGYEGIDVRVFPLGALGNGAVRESSLMQYSAEYVELSKPERAVIIRFEGVPDTPLLDVDVDADGCWWSNRGDSISSTLTRRVDLSNAESASLRYQIWHEIEEGWDYGYVEVSSDGGVTWDILPATGTTTDDPAGNSYGQGYTGITADWLDAQADLSAYSGRGVDVRFQYVTDDSVNGTGFCVDDISIPEVGFEDSLDQTGWAADGFLRTSNRVVQDYAVQVVEVGPQTKVTTLTLDELNRGELRLDASPRREQVVVVVGALAPKTRQPSTYRLSALDAGG